MTVCDFIIMKKAKEIKNRLLDCETFKYKIYKNENNFLKH